MTNSYSKKTVSMNASAGRFYTRAQRARFSVFAAFCTELNLSSQGKLERVASSLMKSGEVSPRG